MKDIAKAAQRIAGSPEDYLEDPAAFTAAWALLKAARGQRFDPARLRPQHLVDHPAPAPEPTAQTLDRISQKTRKIMSAKGYQPHQAA